jgi:scyllo-inositol 2-dehydrogenase (NADP+)
VREIGVGLVGYGFGGSVFHAPLIRSVRQLRLTSVVTSRKEQVLRDMPEVRVVPTVEALLEDPDIALVVISSPSASHFEVARAALQAGKHLVVDKPFATTVEDADALIELADRQRLRLSVFQNRRWDNDFLTVRDCIARGWLGTVYHYEAHFDRFRTGIKAGWREESGIGTGILYDLGAHLIDQALVQFGMPSAVTADVFAQRPAARAVDYFHLVLNYGRMRVILHGATLVAGPGPHFAVHGDGGSFLKYGMDSQEAGLMAGKRPGDAGWGLDDPTNYGELVSADGTRRKVETLPGAYQHYYEQIAAGMESGGAMPVDPADSRDGLMVIEAALRSASERRTVSIP